jgi:hypothetical protein
MVFTPSVDGSLPNSEYSKEESIKKRFIINASKIISNFEKEANKEK